MHGRKYMSTFEKDYLVTRGLIQPHKLVKPSANSRHMKIWNKEYQRVNNVYI